MPTISMFYGIIIVRKNWSSFASVERSDEDYLTQREDIFDTERVKL